MSPPGRSGRITADEAQLRDMLLDARHLAEAGEMAPALSRYRALLKLDILQTMPALVAETRAALGAALLASEEPSALDEAITALTPVASATTDGLALLIDAHRRRFLRTGNRADLLTAHLLMDIASDGDQRTALLRQQLAEASQKRG